MNSYALLQEALEAKYLGKKLIINFDEGMSSVSNTITDITQTGDGSVVFWEESGAEDPIPGVDVNEAEIVHYQEELPEIYVESSSSSESA